MEGLDYWRLCDSLSIIQAALLIVEQDPSSDQHYVEGWGPENRPSGYEAVKSALQNAIKRKTLKAEVVHHEDQYGNSVAIDLNATTVSTWDLVDWLSSRGIEHGFFFPDRPKGPRYLDTQDPNYAPKLAAAVRAWAAVSSDLELRRGKSVKEALKIWLRQNANHFGLTKEDGNPNDQGIEEIAKVANWDPAGGAPKTPGN